MPAITEILQSMARAGNEAADGMSRLRGEVQGLTREASQLSNVQAPATFSGPGPTTPGTVLGPGGSPVGGIVPPSSPGIVTRGGGGGGGGGTGGGSGSGRVVVGETLRSLDGRRATREWVESFCHRVELTVPGLTPGSSRTVNAWDCGQFGTYLDDESVLATVSLSSSGGSSAARTDFGGLDRTTFGSGIAHGGTTARGRMDDSQSSRENLTGSSTQGIEQRLDRTNSLLEEAVRGDGGAGFRAEGGF